MSKVKLNKTRNDLSAKARGAMCELLQARLADAADLASQTKQAHWNVKGASFIALHELFDGVYEVVSGAVDDLAERMVQLGGEPEGTVRAAARASSLKEYPLGAADGLKHCSALADALARFGKLVRASIDEASKAGDADTADLFTEVSRGVDKQLWFVEAHLG